MAQTFAEKMVAKYEELLEANAGLASVNVDGQQVSYSDLEAKYGHWLKKVAQQGRSRVTHFDLSGGGYT